MPRLCIDCLLAEKPCSASHLLATSARSMLAALRGSGDAKRAHNANVSTGLRELCEF